MESGPGKSPIHSHSKFIQVRNEKTLNYRMIVEWYPKPNGVFGSLITGLEIFSLLDKETSLVAIHFLCFPKKSKFIQVHFSLELSLNELHM